MMAARKATASGSWIAMRVPSAAGVMQAITIFPCCVVLVLELLDGALAAGADGSERGMPAEIGQIESRRETAMQQILFRIHLVRLSVDMNRRHSYLHGHRFSRMCRSKSSRKYFNALSSGSAAPGASAQNVAPGPHILA